MKPFRFTLEPLLIIRERQERNAQEEYARALADQRKAMYALHEAERELEQAYAESRKRLTEGAPVSYVVQQQLYCTHLESRRRASAIEVSGAEEKVKVAIQAMIAARQQREVVEKFRTNQKTIYDRQFSNEEQKLLDELAGRRVEPALNLRFSDYD